MCSCNWFGKSERVNTIQYNTQRVSTCKSECRGVTHIASERFWNLLQDQLLEGPTLIQAGRDAACLVPRARCRHVVLEAVRSARSFELPSHVSRLLFRAASVESVEDGAEVVCLLACLVERPGVGRNFSDDGGIFSAAGINRD